MFVICIRVEAVAVDPAEPIQEPEPQEEQAQAEDTTNPEQSSGKPRCIYH